MLVLPLQGGREHRVTPEKIAEWQTTYPSLDVYQELLRAIQWIRDNPHRKKKDGNRYLNNWLKNESGKYASKRPPKNASEQLRAATAAGLREFNRHRASY